MAEEEVSYSSVVIKSKKQPQSEDKNENETVYDEVKINKVSNVVDDAEVEKQNESEQQTSHTKGLLPDRETERCRRYRLLCFCFGTLCVILVLSVIGVSVYFTTVCERNLNQLKSTQKDKIQNLTDLNKKLSSENRNLTSLNEKLMEESKNLTELMKYKEETWNGLNVSLAQWIIDAYCPKQNGVRSCTSCQKGWNYQLSSCYAYNNAPPSYQKNWEGAREDCKKKYSDLTVVSNQTEKDYVKTQTPFQDGINGYWIGLRAVGSKWKWLDGSDLTDQSWMQQQTATDGYCVTSRSNREWTSVNCTDKNAWICEKKALSV